MVISMPSNAERRLSPSAPLRSPHMLVIFAVGWSVGEFFSYAFGDGGASLSVRQVPT